MLKLKLQYFGHLIRWADSLEKTLTLGKIEGRRRRERQRIDGWMTSQTQWTWIWASSGRWWKTGNPCLLQSTGSQRVRHNLVTEQQFPSVQLAFLAYFWAHWQRKDFSYSPIVFFFFLTLHNCISFAKYQNEFLLMMQLCPSWKRCFFNKMLIE